MSVTLPSATLQPAEPTKDLSESVKSMTVAMNTSAKTWAADTAVLHTVSVKRSKSTVKSAQTVTVTKTAQSAAQPEHAHQLFQSAQVVKNQLLTTMKMVVVLLTFVNVSVKVIPVLVSQHSMPTNTLTKMAVLLILLPETSAVTSLFQCTEVPIHQSNTSRSTIASMVWFI